MPEEDVSHTYGIENRAGAPGLGEMGAIALELGHSLGFMFRNLLSDILDVERLAFLGPVMSPLHLERASGESLFTDRFIRFMFRSKATFATG